MEATLGDALELAAERRADADAIRYPHRDRRWTFAELDATVNRLADALIDRGIAPGDRVATLLYNGGELVLTAFACAKIGAVFTPISYRYPPSIVEYVLDDARDDLLVFEAATRSIVDDIRGSVESTRAFSYVGETPPPYGEAFDDLVESGSDGSPRRTVTRRDPCTLLYTSGTTGRPKGVLHDHGSVVEHNLIFIAESGLQPDDVGLSALPLYHAGELRSMLFPRIHRGATTVVHREFDPERVLRAVEAHDVTTFFASPTGWKALVDAATDVDADLSSFRLGAYGAAPMPEGVLERCFETFGAAFLQGYGMTELGPVASVLRPEDHREKRGSAGTPVLNHAIRVVDVDGDPTDRLPHDEVGEIVIAGPCTMREYWNRPETTSERRHVVDGREWFVTGDLGYVDADGYLYVVDRKDDLIITGGTNVYPSPIEDVLRSHPDVVEAAVVGEPHEEWGEQVVGYVVGEASAGGLDEFLRDSDDVADYARPRRYYFVESLPTNTIGKVQKFKLRDGDAAVDADPVEP